MEENRVMHMKTTPKWAQANAKVERQDASLKATRITHSEELDREKEQVSDHLSIY